MIAERIDTFEHADERALRFAVDLGILERLFVKTLNLVHEPVHSTGFSGVRTGHLSSERGLEREKLEHEIKRDPEPKLVRLIAK